MEMTLKPTDLVDFTSLFHQEGFILKKWSERHIPLIMKLF